jgi:D-alanyl-lipoteichoic acid acyltransferase DltB (MBOAT superfamily)
MGNPRRNFDQRGGFNRLAGTVAASGDGIGAWNGTPALVDAERGLRRMEGLNFISITYLLIFPAVLFLHWMLPSKWRWVLLLLASYLFYMMWNPQLVFLMVGVTGVSYLTAKKMGCGVKRKLWMALGSGSILLVLFLFKYLDFAGSTLYTLLAFWGETKTYQPLNLILPVGISFYTFQAISYLMEVYSGRIKAEGHFGYYALYLAFFPQLVAGPIETPQNLLPQLREERCCNQEMLKAGFFRILLGYFKKVAVANFLAPLVDLAYATPDTAPAPAVLLGTVLFALQIYCDFSGYSDIAVGSAKMLGIRLMENFDQPYRAESMRDFWHRWHISLTRCFTQYLYLPLGGSKHGTRKMIRNTMLVFLLSGLWHGASWNYVVWGGLHGSFLVAEHFLRGNTQRLPAVVKRLGTFALVCFAWVFFRAETLSDAGCLIFQAITNWGPDCFAQTAQQLGVTLAVLAQIAVRLMLLQRMQKCCMEQGIWKMNQPKHLLVMGGMILMLMLAWIGNLSGDTNNTFIYFQF